MKLPPLLVFSILRLLAFLVPFGIMMLFPIFRQDPWIWLAMLFATLIGLSLSIIFLRRPLGEASQAISARRGTGGEEVPAPVRDEDVEDEVIDAVADVPEAQPDEAGSDASR